MGKQKDLDLIQLPNEIGGQGILKIFSLTTPLLFSVFYLLCYCCFVCVCLFVVVFVYFCFLATS